MSSLEANAYLSKASVQVGSSITVTKPIIASNLLVKPPASQPEHRQQPNQVQPVTKTIRDNNTGCVPRLSPAATPPVFHLKSSHKAAPTSLAATGVQTNCSRVEVTRKTGTGSEGLVLLKRPLVETGVRKINKAIKPSPQAIQKSSTQTVKKLGTQAIQKANTQPLQKRILAVQPKPEFIMGNEQATAQGGSSAQSAVASGSDNHTLTQASSHSNIPVPVAAMNANMSHSLNPRMASIINSPGDTERPADPVRLGDTEKPGDIGRPGSNAPSMSTLAAGPRVVSTSSSKTITGGGVSLAMTGPGGPIRQQISHRGGLPVTPFGQRATFIPAAAHSTAAVRGQQQPIVRSVTPPTGPTHRPLNPTAIALVTSTSAGSGPQSHQPHNPTTVQITIHQPKHSAVVSGSATSSADKLLDHSHPQHAYTTTVPGSMVGASTVTPPPPHVTLSTQQGLQQQQRLVIPHSTSVGTIQHNKTAVALIATHESSRIISTHSPGHTLTSSSLKRSVRALGGGSVSIGSTGQHDYSRTDTIHVAGTASASMKKSGASDTFRTSRPVLPPSTHAPMEHMAPTMSGGFFSNTSSGGGVGGNFHPTTINHLDQNQPVFKAHNYNSMSLSHHISTGGPGLAVPTIIASTSRPQSSSIASSPLLGDNNTTPAASVAILSSRHGGGGGVSPSILRKRTLVDRPIDKDNASQSSTDTAMSSESPNQHQAQPPTVKTEPVDSVTLENGVRGVVGGSTEGHMSDVSPRKKPRKQLLNTAAQLKDRHDSSTEEETETKKEPCSPSPSRRCVGLQQHTKTKDGFTDSEGCKWVKMRLRQADPLLCFYNCTWKSRNNHFQRHSDVKVKDERRPVVSELSNQRGIQQKASGWKLHHISAQFEEMMESEEALNKRMGRLQRLLPGRGKDRYPELHKISELAQANKQRCTATKDQLNEAQSSMISILTTHKPKILEIIQRNHSKRPVKKKERT